MIRGLHHAGLSVQNLDRSIEFYCGLLGMELLRQSGFGGQVMDEISGLKDTRGRGAMLRAGAQYLELFEFATPTPKPNLAKRPVCDHGITHFCLEVTDIQVEYARLKAAGVEFHCPPQAFGSKRATYARDPDDNVIELLEMPDDIVDRY